MHYFQHLGVEVKVARNDQITLAEISAMRPDHIVISPGPGTPDDAGICLAIINKFNGQIPILGVCLGHQCIAQHFGAKVEKSKKVMHGKTSLIHHNNKSLFKDLNLPLQVTRYHSLIVNKNTLPKELAITAWTPTVTNSVDEIMAIEHKNLAIMGVQFHPESVLTEQGQQLLNNFLTLTS